MHALLMSTCFHIPVSSARNILSFSISGIFSVRIFSHIHMVCGILYARAHNLIENIAKLACELKLKNDFSAD